MITQTRTEPEMLLGDLEKAKKLRQEFAGHLNNMAETLNQAELIGESASGKLCLERDISDLNLASNNLRDGVFRLLVLGDMKRGKSTFLNALIGEKVLPADVNPCTAVLTILRFGQQKTVTVHFNDGKTPEELDFDSFKRRYTIPAAEAKKLEEEGRQAFPDVDYAVVKYPLEILEKGVEIIDSPGLNDTEARNNLTLSYIQNCHAILFVLSATQPCTLGERRYLENYIKERGLTVFFLVNQWDRVRESLVEPDDIQELRDAEERLRQVFESNLFEYCQVEGQDLYDERVFELSSLEALRRRLKQLSLAETGFSEFMEALNTFLTKERIVAEMRQVRTLARQTYVHTHEAIERRLPLLEHDLENLKQKIKSVQPEFTSLTQIRDAFKDEIRRMRDYYANSIADSFHNYILNIDTTFEEDFKPYQPDLKIIDLLKKNKRQEFEEAIKQSFEKYINDKIAAWSRSAEQNMNEAFKQLAASASQYGASYNEVTDKITEKLVGKQILEQSTTVDKSSGWMNFAKGATAFLVGDYAGAVMAGTGAFNWKNVAINIAGMVAINAALIAGFGVALGPLGLALSGAAMGGFQLTQARKALVKKTKEEMVKHLPDLAQKQAWTVHEAVKETFDVYEKEVVQRMNDDIQARQAELENLLSQKESQEIDRDVEVKRLKTLDGDVFSQWNSLEVAYDNLLGVKA